MNIKASIGTCIVFCLITSALLSVEYTFDEETKKNHPFINDRSTCIQCHDAVKTKHFTTLHQTCDQMCFTCHEKLKDSHHAVGIPMYGEIPEGLGPLSQRKKLACITCHNLAIPTWDTAAWQAESMYDSMFKKKEQYKTYHLVLKNNKGQLCNKCH